MYPSNLYCDVIHINCMGSISLFAAVCKMGMFARINVSLIILIFSF